MHLILNLSDKYEYVTTRYVSEERTVSSDIADKLQNKVNEIGLAIVAAD